MTAGAEARPARPAVRSRPARPRRREGRGGGGQPPREAALQALCDIEVDGAFARQAVERVSGTVASPADRRLAHALVMGVTKRRLTLDWALTSVSSRSIDDLAPWLRNLLRMGALQVMYMRGVHAAVAVDSCVRLAREHGHEGIAGFTNGVLRALDRAVRQDRLAWPDRGRDPVRFVSVVHSLPEWLVSRWLGRFGMERLERLASIMNEPPRAVARANLLRTTKEALMERLRAAGVECSPGRLSPEAIVLDDAAGAPGLPQFRDGLFTFQDESSMLAGRALDPRPGQSVVDVCAAPGGKTTHLAELMEDRGSVVAIELYEHRARLIKENIARLGITCVSVRVADASAPPPDLVGTADRVLVDAPCSGTGAFGRRADARWRRRPEDLEVMARTQAAILAGAAALTRPGGTLLYCTCSLEPEENEDVVGAFLRANPDYRPIPIPTPAPMAMPMPAPTSPPVAKEPQPAAHTGPEPFVYVYPDLHGADGFFMAALIRPTGGR